MRVKITYYYYCEVTKKELKQTEYILSIMHRNYIEQNTEKAKVGVTMKLRYYKPSQRIIMPFLGFSSVMRL